ncbi:MAG: glycoside hydrolase family 88 protein [Defluviitaleaceae bacterium]|nr:glycoside hydrolase family 88 protein [Defluviitaleaceae bacterium]
MITKKEINQAITTAIQTLREDLPIFKGKFKPAASKDNYYAPAENDDWTNGFHTGQYWLAWELTREDAFKEAALAHVESFRQRIIDRVVVDHHDMGFLYTLSCVAAWRLVGCETGRTTALMAADNLISRFHKKGGFIQAWGAYGAEDNHRLIIDCLMNLPLLYWATTETSDPKYAEVADIHTATSLQNLIREDHSTYHTYYFDINTGAPLKGVTAQGYKDSSPWARGQAWGIYGLALSYLYTKDPKCIDLFYKVTDFFLNRLPSDMVAYWDLDFTDGNNEPKDSSAAVIAACGMLEMAKHLPKDKADHYTLVATQITHSIAQNYIPNPGESNGLLLHGVYAKASPYNTVSNSGVDECVIWGDYFWLELLTRLSKDWKIYW